MSRRARAEIPSVPGAPGYHGSAQGEAVPAMGGDRSLFCLGCEDEAAGKSTTLERHTCGLADPTGGAVDSDRGGDPLPAIVQGLMTASPLITVHDRTSFAAHVSPEQAAAYVRRHPRLAGWDEKPLAFMGAPPQWLQFKTSDYDVVLVPLRPDFADYSRRMVELVDALVSLGCAQQPSQVLAAMAAIHCERTAPDGDGCWLGPGHKGECRSHAEMGERGEVEP